MPSTQLNIVVKFTGHQASFPKGANNYKEVASSLSSREEPQNLSHWSVKILSLSRIYCILSGLRAVGTHSKQTLNVQPLFKSFFPFILKRSIIKLHA